jgi:hypothetical protein
MECPVKFIVMQYVHVIISIDDGHWLRAMHPLSSSFICEKSTHNDEGSD